MLTSKQKHHYEVIERLIFCFLISVIVRALPETPAVDLDSVLFLENGAKTLGKVFDVFGPVSISFFSPNVTFQTFISYFFHTVQTLLNNMFLRHTSEINGLGHWKSMEEKQKIYWKDYIANPYHLKQYVGLNRHLDPLAIMVPAYVELIFSYYDPTKDLNWFASTTFLSIKYRSKNNHINWLVLSYKIVFR